MSSFPAAQSPANLYPEANWQPSLHTAQTSTTRQALKDKFLTQLSILSSCSEHYKPVVAQRGLRTKRGKGTENIRERIFPGSMQTSLLIPNTNPVCQPICLQQGWRNKDCLSLCQRGNLSLGVLLASRGCCPRNLQHPLLHCFWLLQTLLSLHQLLSPCSSLSTSPCLWPWALWAQQAG